MKSPLSLSRVVAIAALFIAAGPASAALIASLHAEDNPRLNTGFAQSHAGIATRSIGGNVPTRGAVAGTLTVMAGQEVGTSSYDGTRVRTFSNTTLFEEFNRFGNSLADSDPAMGLMVWDYDLSSYLSGVTVGTGIGESMFSLDIDFTGRRTLEANWYVSYSGDGLTLDTTDITTHTVSTNQSGKDNVALATDTSAYKQVLAISDAAGTASVDLTSELATIAAGDGLLRIAYLDGNFRGDITLQGVSGLVETISAIPEPSSVIALSIVGIGVTSTTGRRRHDA